MKRYWIVAQHEFVTQLKRKSFLFMAFVFPIFIAGLSLFTGYLSARQEEQTGSLGQIGIVDQSGVLAGEQDKPAEYITFADEESAASALRDGRIGAYFVLPPDYPSTGVVNAYSHDVIPTGIENQLQAYIETNLLTQWPPATAARLRQPAEISMVTLDGRIHIDERTGIVMILTPIVFAILFIMSISMTSSYMMQNIVEEKETRMVEMITTSITPLELLWGKLIGLSALGVLQILSWSLVGGVALLIRQDIAVTLANINYPLWLLALAILYLLLGYLLYGSLLSGIGASSSSMQEAQPIAGLFSLVAVIPLFVLMQFLENPNGGWPVFLSLLPFTSSAAMMIRLVLGQVPLWQVYLSLGILAASVVLIVWLAAWVFRVGLLLTGQRLTPRTLFRAMRQGRDYPQMVVSPGRQGGQS
jgi:ABC-2 type transport system permease protein